MITVIKCQNHSEITKIIIQFSAIGIYESSSATDVTLRNIFRQKSLFPSKIVIITAINLQLLADISYGKNKTNAR